MFKKGDRVTRPKWHADGTRESLRRGTVEEVYQSTASHVGDSQTLHAVRWDDTKLVERGYIFLDPEVVAV